MLLPSFLLHYSFLMLILYVSLFFFFFNDTATTEIYTLSLHDALPILTDACIEAHLEVIVVATGLREHGADLVTEVAFDLQHQPPQLAVGVVGAPTQQLIQDRKSTRLNSSHDQISYAVFCLKKKKEQKH